MEKKGLKLDEVCTKYRTICQIEQENLLVQCSWLPIQVMQAEMRLISNLILNDNVSLTNRGDADKINIKNWLFVKWKTVTLCDLYIESVSQWVCYS